jgi:hypothetical protein
MKIQVKQSHIDNGEKGSPHNCGLALAIKDFFQDQSINVNVFHTYVELNNKRYKLPEIATKFVFAFDTRNDANIHKELVSPMEFDMDDLEISPLLILA